MLGYFMMMSIGIIAMSVGPLQESELMICHLDADACLPCKRFSDLTVVCWGGVLQRCQRQKEG
jgi:hypothetical protein